MSARAAVIPGDVLKQGRGLNWWQLHPHDPHRREEKQYRLSFKSCSLDSVNDSVILLVKSWRRRGQAACFALGSGSCVWTKTHFRHHLLLFIRVVLVSLAVDECDHLKFSNFSHDIFSKRLNITTKTTHRDLPFFHITFKLFIMIVSIWFGCDVEMQFWGVSWWWPLHNHVPVQLDTFSFVRHPSCISFLYRLPWVCL